MTTTFRAKSPADLLRAIPAMAGYIPQDSVVLIPFCDTTSIGLFRFDIPSSEPARFAATALGIVCRLEEVTGLVGVVYAAQCDATPLDHPFTELLESLSRTSHACGIDIGDIIVVASAGWFSESDTALRSHTEIATPLEFDSPKPRPSQTSGTRLPRIDSKRMGEVRDALTLIDAEFAGAEPRDIVCRIGNIHELFESVLESPRGEPAADAMLIWLVSKPSFRDVALSQWCHGSDTAAVTLSHQLDWLDGIPYPEGDVFLMGEGVVPDAARLRAALARMRHIAASASGRDRAAPLACAAWINWALGHSTHADAYARRALKAQPSHGLATIITTMCAHGHLPSWAFPAENRRKLAP